MRRFLIGFIVFGSACAGAARSQAEAPVTRDVRYRIAALPTFDSFFNLLRERLIGHGSLPDTETVLCLYGVVQQDTAYLAFVMPTKIEVAHANGVKYSTCPKPNAGHFGALRYVGMWHNHPNYEGRDGCWFSVPDVASFERDVDAVVDLVSCRGKTIVTGKPVALQSRGHP
jgi:hypothetical protein